MNATVIERNAKRRGTSSKKAVQHSGCVTHNVFGSL